MIRMAKLVLFSFSLILAAGCSDGTGGTRSDYGISSGIAGRNSLNGFGALRGAYETSGFSSRDVFRLNTRTHKSNVIVWTPQVLNPIPSDVSRWMDGWLAQGKRTLVYIVPDSGSEVDYWQQTRKAAPPKQRMEYRRRLARKINERTSWQNNRREVPTNGWFRLIPSVQAWNSERDGVSEKLTTEFVLQPYNQPSNSNAVNQPATPAGAVNFYVGPTGPGSQYSNSWGTSINQKDVGFKTLESTESGATIVAELTRGKWRDSRVIVVAGGSLLTNFAMTRDKSVQIANDLVRLSHETAGRSKPKAGFLTSSHAPIPISEQASRDSMMSGMEFLTVWPLSLVTIHATLLGFVICMILYPIFGRPRRIDRGSSSDFGDHLDAVAGLMSKSRGESYARRRISEYMVRMKGETSGKWVIKERSQKPTAAAEAKDQSPAT